MFRCLIIFLMVTVCVFAADDISNFKDIFSDSQITRLKAIQALTASQNRASADGIIFDVPDKELIFTKILQSEFEVSYRIKVVNLLRKCKVDRKVQMLCKQALESEGVGVHDSHILSLYYLMNFDQNVIKEYLKNKKWEDLSEEFKLFIHTNETASLYSDYCARILEEYLHQEIKYIDAPPVFNEEFYSENFARFLAFKYHENISLPVEVIWLMGEISSMHFSKRLFMEFKKRPLDESLKIRIAISLGSCLNRDIINAIAEDVNNRDFFYKVLFDHILTGDLREQFKSLKNENKGQFILDNVIEIRKRCQLKSKPQCG